MFSNGQFDLVAEMDDEPQGVIMPPLLPDGPGFNWYSEGDLISKLADKFSPEFAVEVIEAHRDTYITDEDLEKMVQSGISAVRMPLGYWAFLGDGYNDEAVLYTDPAHNDKKFVTISTSSLTSQVQKFVKEGLDVLLDIHAFPGGSSQGSYSGIFPSTPMFWEDEELQQQGLDIVSNMCDFYLGLNEETRAGIIGMTLMNEPAHNLDGKGQQMTEWMSKAVDIFREKVVKTREVASLPFPKLYLNFIETSLQPQEMVDFFLANFSEEELASWAILDVHHYFAWDGGHNGCFPSDDNQCSYNCSDSATDSGLDAISSTIIDGAKSSHEFFFADGSIPLVSCSEYSLATFDRSEQACRGATILKSMFDNQATSFEKQGLYGAYFWTWKMPYSGAHEEAWSLKNFLGLGS